MAASSHKSGNARFALGLLNPAERLCVRQPGLNYFPTATATWRTSLAVSPATGCNNLMVFFLPSQSVIGSFNNIITDSNTQSLWQYNLGSGGSEGVIATYTNIGNFAASRMVSAEIRLIDLNPVNTRSGTFISGTGSVLQVYNGSVTTESLKNVAYNYQVTTSAETGGRAVAIPLDPTHQNFISGTTSTGISSWTVPWVLLKGGISGGNYQVEVHVNYETLPLPANDETVGVFAPENADQKGPSANFNGFIQKGYGAIMDDPTLLTTSYGYIRQALGALAGAGAAVFGQRLHARLAVRN